MNPRIMNWLKLARKPESEVMDSPGEVSAYASSASQGHLDSLDDTLVAQLISLEPPAGMPSGLLLDLGCGPGGIALKIAARCPQLQVIGVDRSASMIRLARRTALGRKLASRAFFLEGNALRICFPEKTFDFVISNSVLHHLAHPTAAFEEMVRVTKPGGTILVRDLRRPSRLTFPLHVRWYGRHYSGIMKRLFEDSVRAAYTPDEVAALLRRSGMSSARMFLHKGSHLGFVYRSDRTLARQV